MDNFLPWEVVPCKENDRSAIYEVDEDGNAYGNIYELRKVVNAKTTKREYIYKGGEGGEGMETKERANDVSCFFVPITTATFRSRVRSWNDQSVHYTVSYVGRSDGRCIYNNILVK